MLELPVTTMNLSAILEQRPSTLSAFVAGLAGVLVLGVFDFLTGYEVSMFVFYGIPIVAVAWFTNKKWALLLAILAGLVWWWADRLTLHPYRWGWLQAWETIVRLAFFIFAALSGSLLKAYRESTESRIKLLEHSNQLEQEVVNISEQERRRIGEDLHDGVCQGLAALGCWAASLQVDLQHAGNTALAASAKGLAEKLNDSVTQTRDLARGLVPVQMGSVGLAWALEELTASASQIRHINCIFSGETDALVSDQTVATHLYRIAQEAINNATRHGKASGIDVHLRSDRDAIELSVEDNGRGITSAGFDCTGMGLKIMRYRARCLGGGLQIGPRPGGGTVVRCSVPQKMCSDSSNGHSH